MTIAEELLAEFEREARTTRRFLERIPEGQLSWRPHPKSMTAGQLGLHMASFPGPVVQLAKKDESPVPDFNRINRQPESLREILDTLDTGIAAVRENLPTFTDAQIMETWRMTKDGQTVLAIPRKVMLRNVLLNHWYHHRGQLGVYLRLLGADVPSAYGPSGDELPEFLPR